MTGRLIYFDHASTTPLDPRVFEVMKPYFADCYGNPSSIYKFAQEARKAVDFSRETVAEILECKPREILFTSGGTESNNMFLLGAAYAYEKYGRHIITTKIEHDSVLKPLEYLESKGFEVTYLDVGESGVVDVADVERALRPDTILVSVMYANNEIGTIQPISEITQAIAKFKQLADRVQAAPFFHTDACQAAPYLDISVKNLGVDALTMNGSKIYGPKGAGMLFIREGISLVPLIFGGGQEYRKRSGTENVPAIIGFGEALKLVQSAREIESARLLPLRDRLIDGLIKNIPDARRNGNRAKRLPNNVNISFRGVEGEGVLLRLDMLGVAASAGSACTSGSLEPSHVIRALGYSEEWTHAATRFTLGHGNTEEEVEFVLKEMPRIIEELREMSPFL